MCNTPREGVDAIEIVNECPAMPPFFTRGNPWI